MLLSGKPRQVDATLQPRNLSDLIAVAQHR